MNKKVVSVNRSVLYALDTITVRLKETEKQLSVAYKDIENLVKEKDMLYEQLRKYKAVDIEFVNAFDILHRKGAFKNLGVMNESKIEISRDEMISDTPIGAPFHNDEQEYDTGVRVGKVESEADTDNKKDK